LSAIQGSTAFNISAKLANKVVITASDLASCAKEGVGVVIVVVIVLVVNGEAVREVVVTVS